MRERWLRSTMVVLPALAVLLAGACTSSGDEAEADERPDFARCETGSARTSGSLVTDGDPVPAVTEVWIAGVSGATSVDFDGDTGGIFVTAKSGQLHFLAEPVGGDGEVVLDLSDRVASEEQEQGLFTVALSKDYQRLYLSYAALDDTLTVVGYDMVDGLPDPESERVVIEIPQPGPTHNGGQLVTDDEGMLWISVGDGESAPLDDVLAWGNAREAQSLDNLYGTILRIDPRPDGDAGYTVPPDNPFVDVEGAEPEIWAYGLRNPWRFTFDRDTGDLWIGDVGQFCWEEIDFAPADDGAGAGENFGWPVFEGDHLYRMEGKGPYELPVYEISREADDRGLKVCSVAGGYVYRGEAIPQLQGAYVYGDTCHTELFALVPTGDGWERRSLGIDLSLVVGFGQDPRGELYVVSMFDGVHRLDPDLEEMTVP